MNINDHVFRLLQSEPFFAALSRVITKRSTTQIPTAGVFANKKTMQYEMHFNPDFVRKLNDSDIKSLLMHELYHIVFGHTDTRSVADKHRKRWNIACDLAINGIIHFDREGELYNSGCVPGVGQWENMPSGHTAEWYYDKIGDKEDESTDSHDGWGDAEANGETGIVSAVAEQAMRNALQEAVKSAVVNGWGSVPSNMQATLIDLSNKSNTVCWKSVLRQFIISSIRADQEASIFRINKRYPYQHPGVKHIRLPKMAISIDQSGSVSDDLLEKFFVEISKLSAMVSFTIIPFDTEVDKSLVYEVKKGTKLSARRVKNGGTDFNAPTQYVNENRFDAHIVLTDMCAPTPTRSRCKRLWVTNTGASKECAGAEQVIFI